MASSVRTILASELHQLASDLASQAPGLTAGSEDAASQCLGLCERLGQVAEMIEAPALQDVAIFLISNIPALLGNEASSDAPASLCAELELCLLEGAESGRWPQLSANLCDARWPASMDAEAADAVTSSLKPLAVSDENEEAPAPAPTLSAADMTLSAPEDVGQETLLAFFQEGPVQAAQLSRVLGDWFASAQPDSLAEALRLTHTLKGSSALCGLHAIAHLTHAMETTLQQCAASGSPVPQAQSNRLLEASDLIEQLIELAAIGAPAPEGLVEIITELYGVDAARAEVEGTVIDESPDETDNVAEPIHLSPRSEQPVRTTALSPQAELGPTLSVPVALIDENLRRAGEMNIAIGQLLAQVTDSLGRANRLAQQLSLVQGQVYELETLVDTRGIPALRAQTGADPHADFDPLEMDEYTALHSLSRAFAESTLDSRELSRELGDELLKLQNLIAQHARLGKDLSDSVTGARLVPVATIVPRLERIVRQTARQTGRQVELTVDGRDLSIDTDILNGLVEPLMHSLRNAIDHGLESANDRLALNKPAVGQIRVTFRRDGNRIEVTCADDGRGLDYAAIERRGFERGLISAGAQLSPKDLSALIFVPGFSTRTEVTSISGRGVGMDVVRTSIERLKGTVQLHSETGAGCSLAFRLPLSLTSAHALFVTVGDATYGLPSTSVEQVLYSDAGRVLEIGDQYAFEYADQVAPLYPLAQLLGESSALLEDIAAQPKPLVLVQSDAGLVALAVDRALDSRQILIKGLPRMLPSIPGISGACVLPNGTVGVILEVRELLRTPLRVTVRDDLTAIVAQPRATKAPCALVVDDSLSARRSLAQLLGDSGFDVMTAVDGMDAIDRIEERVPDIMLIDMEMPRMNGLELTAHLRGRSELGSLPIVMITSRAADKHRSQAMRAGVSDYLTKPYLEQDLMERLDALVTRP